MTTIGQRLLDVAENGHGQLVFHLDDGIVTLPMADVAEKAVRAASQLVREGVCPGDHVGLLGRNRPEWAIWAFGTWLAGAALVPLQLPVRILDPEAMRDRTRSIIDVAGCRKIVVEPDLTSFIPDDLAIPWTIPSRNSAAHLPDVDPAAMAVIQFTSGSTSQPRGVLITHDAALAQMACLVGGTSVRPEEDRTLGWVPFFHDLGLFGFLLLPALHMDAGHVLPTERFARDPGEWLRLVSRTGATVLDSPQPAWGSALTAARRRGSSLDLSSVTVAWFGSERLDPNFLDQFLQVAPEIKLAETAVGNTYGLAEAVMGVAATPLGEEPHVIEFDPEPLTSEGIVAIPRGKPGRIVSSGRPARDMRVRVVDDADSPQEENRIGHIQVAGPSLMAGYLNADPAEAFADGWVRTGDMGFLREGELCVTGRAKDMLIVMGHNYHPEDFEWAAGRVPGVRPGRNVAFTTKDEDRIVLLVEAQGSEELGELARTVSRAVRDAVGAPADVQLVPPGTIEKTTSGKLRRQAMRERYAAGAVPVLST